MEPIISQKWEIIDQEGESVVTQKTLSTARKHKITDAESEKLLNTVKNLGEPWNIVTKRL